MTDFEKTLIYTQKVAKELELARIEALKTINKKIKIFDSFNDFVKGFDSIEEAENFLTTRVSKLWLDAMDNKEFFGHFLPCDVKTMKEAKARVKSFFKIVY